MSIYIQDKMAFVDLGNYMLCIGSEDEVRKADETRILEMIAEAVKHAQFRSISSSAGQAIH